MTTKVPHAHTIVDGKVQCPVIQLAVDRFGLERGMEILWEETCFPMDDEIAMQQLQAIVTTHDVTATPAAKAPTP